MIIILIISVRCLERNIQPVLSLKSVLCLFLTRVRLYGKGLCRGKDFEQIRKPVVKSFCHRFAENFFRMFLNQFRQRYPFVSIFDQGRGFRMCARPEFCLGIV